MNRSTSGLSLCRFLIEIAQLPRIHAYLFRIQTYLSYRYQSIEQSICCHQVREYAFSSYLLLNFSFLPSYRDLTTLLLSFFQSAVLPLSLSTHLQIQEPRKSDAPQLRDEYRTYKILAGCREYLSIELLLSFPHLDVVHISIFNMIY